MASRVVRAQKYVPNKWRRIESPSGGKMPFETGSTMRSRPAFDGLSEVIGWGVMTPSRFHGS